MGQTPPLLAAFGRQGQIPRRLQRSELVPDSLQLAEGRYILVGFRYRKW